MVEIHFRKKPIPERRKAKMVQIFCFGIWVGHTSWVPVVFGWGVGYSGGVFPVNISLNQDFKV